MAAAAAGAAAAAVAAMSRRDAALFRTDSGAKLVRITGCWAPTKIWAICPPISLHNHVVSVDTTSINTFKDRLDKFWSNQDVLYDYKADLHGIGNRTIIM